MGLLKQPNRGVDKRTERMFIDLFVYALIKRLVRFNIMNPLKATARRELANTLRKHKMEVADKISRNKFDVNRLTERQTVLKRKLAEIDGVINSLVT